MAEQTVTTKKRRFPQFALALLAVLAVDFWLGSAHPLTKATTQGLDRSETFSTACVYQKQEQAPDVVLLGSSLVVAPVMQAEALHLGKPFPRFLYRNSEYLSSALGKTVDATPSVFCFAVAGEAVSDAYLITKHILKSEKKPRLIVYGIAPRDFQDNTCPGVYSTEAFNVLADLNDVMAASQRNKLPFDRTADLALSKVSALWKYRADVRLYANLRMKKTMERFLPWVVFEKYDASGNLAVCKKGQFPEEAIGTIQAFPNLAMENAGNIKTIQQYIRRYRPENPAAVNEQFSFLRQLISRCKHDGVELLLVNMPLSKTNIDLLPDGFYQRYISRLTQECQHNEIKLVDLAGGAYLSEEIYTDTVHMKPAVSQKFMDLLASKISDSGALLSFKRHERLLAGKAERKY